MISHDICFVLNVVELFQSYQPVSLVFNIYLWFQIPRETQPSSKSWENQRDMAVANQQAKRDVIVSKDALLKSYRKRLKVNKTAQQSCIEDSLKILGEGWWYWINDFVATFGVKDRPIYMVLLAN